MATQLTDVLIAVDSYMASNGAGKKYLAKKFKSLFEGKDALLNAEDGPLAVLSEETRKTIAKTKVLNTTTDSLISKMRLFRDAMKYGHFKQLADTSESLQKKLKGFRDNVGKISGNSPNSSTNERTLKILSRIERNTFLTYGSMSSINRLYLESRRERVLDTRSNKLNSNITRPYYYNSINNKYDPSRDSNSGGLLGKVLKTLLVGSASFIGLGIIGKFLDTNYYGKIIKDTIKKGLSFIGDGISSIIKDGTVNRLFDDSLSFIKKVFSYTVDGITDFIKNNKESILNMFSGLGKSIKDQIISPLIGSIGNDIAGGDILGLGVKGAVGIGAWKMISKIPIFNTLTKMSGSTLAGLAGVAGRIPPPILLGMAALGTIAVAANSIQKSVTKIAGIQNATRESLNDSLEKQNEAWDEFITIIGERISFLERKEKSNTITPKEKIELDVSRIEKSNADLQRKIGEIQNNYDQTTMSWKNLTLTTFGLKPKTMESKTASQISALQSEILKNQQLIDRISNPEKAKQQDAKFGNIMNSIKKNMGEMKGRKNAIITTPPLEKTEKGIKELTTNVMELKELMNSAMTALITATSTGNNAIVGAIASSNSKPVVVNTPGRDPILDFRDRTNTRLSR